MIAEQVEGLNWIWYCGKSNCWIVSDLAPNDELCKAGIVSSANETSTDPLSLTGPWKYWDSKEWVSDDDRNAILFTCIGENFIDFIAIRQCFSDPKIGFIEMM